VRPASSADEFVASPVGLYVSGPTFLTWCAAPTLGGTVIWGRPGEQDARAITRLWEYDRALAPGFDHATDMSRLEGVDPITFEILVAWVRARLPTYPGQLRRHAVVRPGGVEGAVVAGFYQMVGDVPYQWRVFERLDAALDWLGYGAALARTIDELVAHTVGAPPSLARLREWLAGRLADAGVDAAARALGSSRRSLQRELKRAGSSFRAELERARVTEAVRLLAESDLKADAVARRVGLTPATLAQLLRRTVGKTPTDLRRAR